MISNILPKKIEDLFKKKRPTLLAVGPMSKNCVDASVEIANEKNIPIILIASRRQVDCKELGGGYVNNWDTKEFSAYVQKLDKKKNVFLARDHGGPWQNNLEIKKKLTEKQAMKSAKLSFKNDIDSGFHFIHIDTSLSLSGIEKNQKKSFKRLFELYKYCSKYAKSKNKKIYFEIGTEEQSGTTNTPEELRQTLKKVIKFCESEVLPKPSFVVIQSGTKVMETKNVGSFDSPIRVENEIPAEIQLPKMIELCETFNVMMKAHNTDYLSETALSWHPKIGIHAANVAPEFGVRETLSLIKVMDELKLTQLKKKFNDISFKSKKWKKWVIDKKMLSKEDMSIICGHYNFSKKEFLIIKKNLDEIFFKKKKQRLDDYLKLEIKKDILKYLKNFNIL
jgi:tagatose-1,6-bisphosphate aldolase non-catalytic subunit AgaZ/GatZ